MRVRLVGSLIGLVALGGMLLPASALARSLTVTDADVRMRIAPDAALLVSEQLEIEFDGQWQAAYRDILLKKKGETITNVSVSEGSRRYEPGGCTVEGCVDAAARFGAAQIPESEIGKLEGVAEAMRRLLEENPGETFLIEGHTDAVGAEVANLALSDQRAEAVATALTNVFDIPPENMETQGYGEQYLKVETVEPERENRRVAIRRITPLVAPVASAE